MRPVDSVLASLRSLVLPHNQGHRCLDGAWWNPHAGSRQKCPTHQTLLDTMAQVQYLHDRVHAAAHNTDIARAVAEGMTGFIFDALPAEEADGWTHAARLAIEALAAELDRDPDLEARAAAVRDRLTAATAPLPDDH